MVLVGTVVEERDDGLMVYVPFPHDKKRPEGYGLSVGVELVDGRSISAEQRIRYGGGRGRDSTAFTIADACRAGGLAEQRGLCSRRSLHARVS